MGAPICRIGNAKLQWNSNYKALECLKVKSHGLRGLMERDPR